MIGKLMVAAALGAGLMGAQESWLKDQKDLIVRPPTRIDVTPNDPEPAAPQVQASVTGRCSIPLVNFGKGMNYPSNMPSIDTGKFQAPKAFYVQPPAPPCDDKMMESNTPEQKPADKKK